jgi:hypothetical protein
MSREPQPPPQTAAAPTRPPRRWTVTLGMLLAVGLTALLVVLLLMRGSPRLEPDGTIVVVADSMWDGVELVVEGGALEQPLRRPFAPWNKYEVIFFVDHGMYTLRAAQDGQILYERDITLDEKQPTQRINLPLEIDVPPPATQPAAQ